MAKFTKVQKYSSFLPIPFTHLDNSQCIGSTTALYNIQVVVISSIHQQVTKFSYSVVMYKQIRAGERYHHCCSGNVGASSSAPHCGPSVLVRCLPGDARLFFPGLLLLGWWWWWFLPCAPGVSTWLVLAWTVISRWWWWASLAFVWTWPLLGR